MSAKREPNAEGVRNKHFSMSKVCRSLTKFASDTVTSSSLQMVLYKYMVYSTDRLMVYRPPEWSYTTESVLLTAGNNLLL